MATVKTLFQSESINRYKFREGMEWLTQLSHGVEQEDKSLFKLQTPVKEKKNGGQDEGEEMAALWTYLKVQFL